MINPDVPMKEMAMTTRNEPNSWRTRIERSFEGVFFASASLFVFASVLAGCVQPALIAA